MARLVTAGFETGSAQELNGANNGLASVSSVQARTGTYSLAVHGGPINGACGYVTHVFGSNLTEFYFRLAWYLEAGGIAGYPYLQFQDENGDAQLTLVFNGPTQTFKLYRGSESGVLLAAGTIVLRAATWYVLEGHAVIDDATGVFTLKVNGVTDLAVSGADTKATSATGVRAFKIFGPVGATSAELYVDDIAVNDTSGSFQTSYPGLGGVFFLRANGDGAVTEFSPSAGADHYACVDDVPANTTDWVQGENPGEMELFEIEATPDYVTAINLVQPVFQAAVAESGSNELWDVVRQGSTVYSGATPQTVVNLAPGYLLLKGETYYEQPAGGGAWDAAALDALQVGVEIPAWS